MFHFGSRWVPRDPSLVHASFGFQVRVYKNTALEAVGIRPPFPSGARLPYLIGFMMSSIYYRIFLRLPGLIIIGPCMAIIFYSEPSGNVEEPPRLFLVALLPLGSDHREALVSPYSLIIPVPRPGPNSFPYPGAGGGYQPYYKSGPERPSILSL